MKKNDIAYYLDHRGRPQKSIITGTQTQGAWKMYTLKGFGTWKFEGEIFATKEAMLENLSIELLKLD